MNDLTTDRTSLMIAAEINMIRHQTGKILLVGAIEIGRRLKEAKALLPHGEWGKWLEDSVSYSQSTAEKLMRLFEGYGTQQAASLAVGGQGEGLPNLSYSQALTLLVVPEEDRAQFIAELDVESMSIRELQKAVKDRNQAVQERDQAFQEKGDLQKALNNQVSKISQLTTERDSLKSKSEELSKSKGEIETRAGKLQSELNSIKKSTEYGSIQSMSRNLTAAHHKACANQVAFLYENLDKTFKELIFELSRLAPENKNTHEAYKTKTVDFLTKGLKEMYGTNV